MNPLDMVKDLSVQVVKSMELLDQVEFIPCTIGDGFTVMKCPFCHRVAAIGHSDDCKYMAVKKMVGW